MAPSLDGRRPDARAVQRRTLVVLAAAQIVGGVGVATGIAVGALLAGQLGGTAVSGLGQSALVVGSALLAIPVTRLTQARGRRQGLALGFVVGALGAMLVLAAARLGSVAMLFAGLFLFGGASTANLQARYAAVDLAEPARRGRQLSLVVWAATIGSVAGPNLAPFAVDVARRFGAVGDSGPFAVSALAFALAACGVVALLRPDPLVTARALAAGSATGTVSAPRTASAARTASATRTDGDAADADGGVDAGRPAGRGLVAALREVLAQPAARLGIAAVTVGHVVMISVMSMTPVHLDEVRHADSLRVIGLVISIHIAVMYAFSPVTGWLTDRVGRRPVILAGVALLVAGCVVAGLADHDTVGLAVGLSLIGLGWSGTMVAGSTLVSESVGMANRAAVQGLSDLVMGLGGASAAALAGVVVAWSSYATLTALTAVATVPLVAVALRPAGSTRTQVEGV